MLYSLWCSMWVQTSPAGGSCAGWAWVSGYVAVPY